MTGDRLTADLHFAQVPAWVLHADISLGARVLYAELSLRAGAKDQAWPSRARLAADCRVSIRSVDKYLDELVAIGAVTIEQRRSQDRQTSNLYTVRRIPTRAKSAQGRGQKLPPAQGKSCPQPRANVAPELDSWELDSGEVAPLPPAEDVAPAAEPVPTPAGKPASMRGDAAPTLPLDDVIEGEVIEDTPPPTAVAKRRKRQAARDYTSAFEAFYKAYPKSHNKPEAFDAWQAALERGATPAQIMDGVEKLDRAIAMQWQAFRFVRWPQRWLNEDGWDDDYSPRNRPMTNAERAYLAREVEGMAAAAALDAANLPPHHLDPTELPY